MSKLVNLARVDLLETQVIEASRIYRKESSMKAKRDLDRSAFFFKDYVRALSPKIDNALDAGVDVAFIAGGESNVNHIVVIFNGDTFTSMEKLDKIVVTKLKKLTPHLVVDASEKINFNLLGTTSNLQMSSNVTQNKFVACAEFVSAVKIRNFCVIAK